MGDRTINVEMTAGGGGSKSEARRAKIAAKNERVSEQRAKKMKADQEAYEALKAKEAERKKEASEKKPRRKQQPPAAPEIPSMCQ